MLSTFFLDADKDVDAQLEDVGIVHDVDIVHDVLAVHDVLGGWADLLVEDEVDAPVFLHLPEEDFAEVEAEIAGVEADP